MATVCKRAIRWSVLVVVLSISAVGGRAATDVAADVLIPRESIGAGGGGGGAAEGTNADFAVNQNLRSIQLIEGKEVANQVVYQGTSQNLQSILLIESKEPSVTFAHPGQSPF